MSNAMSIAAITRVIKDAIQYRISTSDIAGLDPKIWSLPLDKVETKIASDGNVINLFMYRTTHNQGWRNKDLPSYNNDGDILTKPKLGLDLYYMLSCYGAEDLYAEMMLGYAMQVLHNNPVLAKDFIATQLSNVTETNLEGVKNSRLADQIELIKITPDNVNTEELSRLWTSFGAKYRQSTFYKATVVLIESDEPDRVVIPVKKPLLYVKPFMEPEIIELKAKADLATPPKDILLIQPGNLILILGNSLIGDSTQVLINSELANIVGSPNNSEIIVQIPAVLTAGIQSVQIKHNMKLGEPPVDHKGANSNIMAFVLNPHISNIQLNAGSVSLNIASPIGKDQKVSLLLNELVPQNQDREPNNYKFEFAHNGPIAAGNISVLVPGVNSGDYIVRLRVDRYVSPIVDDVNSYTVNIP
jgi:hypothetical protein